MDLAAIETGFIGALRVAQRAELARRGRMRGFGREVPLFYEGDPSSDIAVIVDGRVKIYSITREGKDIVLAFRGPGDLLGELSAIDGRPRSATVAAIEPVQALLIPADEFRAFLHDHADAAVVLLELVCQRLRDSDRKRIEFAAHDVIGRVAARLLELTDDFGETVAGGVRVTLPLSQDELAGWIGASREAVSKALHTMRELNWVQTERRRITVRDSDALRQRANLAVNEYPSL